MPAEYATFRRPKFLQRLKKWSQWCIWKLEAKTPHLSWMEEKPKCEKHHRVRQRFD